MSPSAGSDIDGHQVSYIIHYGGAKFGQKNFISSAQPNLRGNAWCLSPVTVTTLNSGKKRRASRNLFGYSIVSTPQGKDDKVGNHRHRLGRDFAVDDETSTDTVTSNRRTATRRHHSPRGNFSTAVVPNGHHIKLPQIH